MLKASTRTTYAIRALVEMARATGNGPVQLGSLAERQNIPLAYLQQIFSKLKRAGLVKTLRGPRGGYQLARDPSAITLADIVVTLEGPLQPALCSFPENRSDHCHDVSGCSSRNLCSELDGAIQLALRSNTLGTLMQEADRLRSRPISFV